MKESISQSEEISNSLKEKNLYGTVLGYALECVTAILIFIFSLG